MDRAEKQELVTSMHDVFDNAGVIVVAHYSGLTVAEMTDLRGRARGAGASLKVAKNRLVKLALDGTDSAHAADLFSGPTVIAYSDDLVSAPKVVSEFAKSNDKLVILGGAMGTIALDPQGVKTLADLPSLDELRGKIVGLVSRPAQKIAQVLQAPGGQVARVISAYASESEAA